MYGSPCGNSSRWDNCRANGEVKERMCSTWKNIVEIEMAQINTFSGVHLQSLAIVSAAVVSAVMILD